MKRSFILILTALLCLAALLLTGCRTDAGKNDGDPSKSASGQSSALPSGQPSGQTSGQPTDPTGSASSSSEETSDEPVIPVRTAVEMSEEALLDRLEGGWIGQMIGVTWGAPTEFCYAGVLIPAGSVPAWKSDMINNAFDQDDLYVEIPFLDAMKSKGAFCDTSVIEKRFRDSEFGLWHANAMGRENLKNGLKCPESGSYLNNYHCDDIDWQIECDFLGMMYPGQVSEAAKRAFELGHIMNYGDGVYGGVFVTAMHAAAFTASSIDEIVNAGVSVIPKGTQFRALIEDVLESYRAGDSFEQNWQKLETKWAPYDICPELPGVSNIDAKLNSGYILLGLLYGEGDFAKTITLSMRCGQDSDCNPSSAASILGNFYGASGIPEVYKSALNRTGKKFSFTRYNYEDTLALNYTLLEEVLTHFGGVKSEEKVWSFEKDETYARVPFEQVPDGVFAYLNASFSGNTVRFKELTPFSKNENVVGYTIDTGDGTVFTDVLPSSYVYAKAGKYTLTVTVRGDKGSETTIERKYTVRSDYSGTLPEKYYICTVQAPTGGGNKNIQIISDGKKGSVGSADNGAQYDTYVLGDPHGNPGKTVYIGYIYTAERSVSSVVFTEGKHFGNGGWFKNRDLSIEVFDGTSWKKVECTLSPAYPTGDAMGLFGKSYESYTFTLASPVTALGVRLIGTAGGSATFISVSELEVK